MAVTPGFLGIDEPTTIDKRADTNVVTRAATTVHREVVSIGSADDATPESIAKVDSTGSLRTVSTDAAGTNQQAITAAGDAKITLDGEGVVGTHSDGDANPTDKVATIPAKVFASTPVLVDGTITPLYVDTSGRLSVRLDASSAGLATQSTLLLVATQQTDKTQWTKIADGVGGAGVAGVTLQNRLRVAVEANSATTSVTGTNVDDSAGGNLRVGTSPARANAAAPTWTEGNMVPLSVSLAGALRDDPIDRAARDMGKIDIVSLDQYTPVSGRLPVDGSGVTLTVAIAGSSTSTAPAQTSVGTAAVSLLASNASRKRAIVQNTGTTVIKIALSSTDPTQTAYHIALAPGSAADDGKGGVLIEEKWTGQIKAISSLAGGTVVVTELT